MSPSEHDSPRHGIIAASIALYAILLSVAWTVLTNRAERQTKSMLDYAMLDLDATLNGSIDTMLMHVGDSIADELGTAAPITCERAAVLVAQRDIDEVNVFTREGVNIGSSDPRLPGTKISDNPKSAEFLVLTNGVRTALSQPFRQGAHNPDVRRKYVGVAFPDGSGFVQVGIDESHVTSMFPSIMGFIFDEWLLGETGFFLCADANDGHLISNPARHRDEAANLSETGYDPGAPEVREDGRTTFRQRLFGDICDCRAVVFCGHRLVAALPPAEYYTTRTVYFAVLSIVLLIVMVLFATLLWRIDRDSQRLTAFYAAEEERRAKEISIAASIQESAVPRTFPPFTKEPRVDLFATMQPARNVGGDFYDFFFSGPSRLTFLVADVSGKGIPAALFMMRAKATIKGMSHTGRPLDEVVTEANEALSRDNGADMFVTAWIGELNLATGAVTYVNAGHNPPVLIRNCNAGAAAKPEDFSYLRERSGLMLGAMTGIKYRSHEVRLSAGDAIYLYTDGITEQHNAGGELFGEERLLFSVRTMITSGVKALEPSSSPMLGAIYDASMAHGGDVEQDDDCTQLIIRYNGEGHGGQPVLSRTFPPTQDGISAASDWLDETLSHPTNVPTDQPTNGLTDKRINGSSLLPTLHIILDEIASNIAKHSGATSFDMALEITDNPAGVRITFSDDGVAYDPLAHSDPDTTLPAEERPIGGLGIMMVKKMSSDISYRRDGGRNVLSIFKAVG